MFKAGDRVEVHRPRVDSWMGGTVMERRTRDDGTAIFYVQVDGYVASAPNDPNVWFTTAQIRINDDPSGKAKHR